MTNGESRIRTMIESWVRAVHAGDMDGVLADHADDIVMFDVPPPNEGVRSLEAYRETWPPFFTWQEQGAHSTSCRSTSPQARMSPSRTRCSDAALKRS